MKRQEIYKKIDTELDYVETHESLNDTHITEDFPLSAGLEAIRYNLDKANQSWYRERTPYPQTMEYLRKIAGICVKMGIKYDMKER